VAGEGVVMAGRGRGMRGFDDWVSRFAICGHGLAVVRDEFEGFVAIGSMDELDTNANSIWHPSGVRILILGLGPEVCDLRLRYVIPAGWIR